LLKRSGPRPPLSPACTAISELQSPVSPFASYNIDKRKAFNMAKLEDLLGSPEAETRFLETTRNYQAEMFEESLRRNIIVAVGCSLLFFVPRWMRTDFSD
jgi:hypothetical protein